MKGIAPTTVNLDNFIVGCKQICLSGEVPAMTRAHQGKLERRRVSGRNSLWSERHKSYRKKAGQANSRDSQISVEWLFGARCRMQSHTSPMMPCISAAHHFYGEPNLKIADFQISSRDWGVKSPASSPSAKITKVSFELLWANLALREKSPAT